MSHQTFEKQQRVCCSRKKGSKEMSLEGVSKVGELNHLLLVPVVCSILERDATSLHCVPSPHFSFSRCH